MAFIIFFPCSLNVFVCFSNALPSGQYVNFACSVILLWSDGNISSPVIYSYLSILPENNADIFAAALLISYYSFSFLVLSSTGMINFYVVLKDSF